MKFCDFFKTCVEQHKPIFFDGGMGTMLQGIQAKSPLSLIFEAPDELNITNPDVIENIHAQYVQAGANIITTNTFGSTPIKLEDCRFSAEEIIPQAIKIAKKAINGKENTFVAFDISSTGKLLEPMGNLTFDEAYETYKIAVIEAEKAGADLCIIETMNDIYETKAAVLAVKENTNLPVFASVAFQNNLRTLTGADALTAITYLESLGVDAAGFNCGGSLQDAEKLCAEMTKNCTIPVLVQPNAGLPVIENGKTVFKVEPQEFAKTQYNNFLNGALILGGCCGTTPNHIKEMIDFIKSSPDTRTFNKNPEAFATRICSYNQTVDIGSKKDGPVIIGERINPTGKKKFKQALLDNNMQYILDEGENQINAGAHILDVNVGLPGINEEQMMLSAIKLLQQSFRAPLQIDSSEPNVLETALRYYNGKALINSVNGKEQVMKAVFPLVKKYGGTVVALALDENGIPPTAEERMKIVDKIIITADSYGIKRQDIIFDALTLTISSQQKEALETLKTIRLIKEKYGNKTVLGVSNISFGLPRREIINAHFFTQALASGLDACIINPLSAEMMQAYYAFKAIQGYDANCLDYIQLFANTTAAVQTINSNNSTATKEQNLDLTEIILKGYKDLSKEATEELIKTKEPMEIINDFIIPALDEVGKDFEKGKKFLPQLLLSAETVSNAFEVIKAKIASSGNTTESKGKIVIATVYGDVHDIGKNIVKAMLENYGYDVIDLGKNVPIETVVQAVKTEKAQLVGLSALMTTTVASMEDTIKAIRTYEKEEGIHVDIMVGGAVLTEDYAAKIGADFYSKDAMASVAVAKKVFGK